MGIIIKEMKIPNDSYSFISDDGEKGDVLKNLSKINIFVGENNSGKSRFLRFLVATKNLNFIPNDEDFFKIIQAIPCLKENLSNALNAPITMPELNDLTKLVNEIEITDF